MLNYKAQLPSCATGWFESYLVVQLGRLKAIDGCCHIVELLLQ